MASTLSLTGFCREHLTLDYESFLLEMLSNQAGDQGALLVAARCTEGVELGKIIRRKEYRDLGQFTSHGSIVPELY